ncbi:hypothetical protein DYB28_010405 [Aphanomyces astaci]|uniref:SKP1-like protein n=1 Tax=Aphanomyces astaci TaxID=112090 RepID=A0A9X8HAI2_APHAT|nr:hypothetical protein DYB28_010405 [Aphanomyces astaci]
MTTSNRNLTLTSSEGDAFEVPVHVATMSEVVRQVVEDTADSDDVDIPLAAVKTHVLVKVVEFINYHHEHPMKDIPTPITTSFEDVVDDWDLDFINESYEMIFELILAANYLNISPLLNLACAKISGVIHGRSPDQIREIFDIDEPFTAEEEAFIRQENQWPEIG